MKPSIRPTTLTIKVIEGKLFRNTETFGQMDPFLVIQHKGHKVKTRVIKDGGMHIVWNESFDIALESEDDDLKFTCFDEDLIMDDCVGEATFKASELINVNKWITLEFKHKKAAEILI